MKLVEDKDWITATVGALISELQKFDKDALVLTEGCDCYGNVVAVSIDSDGIVLIERDDHMKHYFGGEYALKAKYMGLVVSR